MLAVEGKEKQLMVQGVHDTYDTYETKVWEIGADRRNTLGRQLLQTYIRIDIFCFSYHWKEFTKRNFATKVCKSTQEMRKNFSLQQNQTENHSFNMKGSKIFINL